MQEKKVTIYKMPELLRKAQMTTIASKNNILRFSSTGKFPFNRDVFTDGDFSPSSMRDRSLKSQDVSFLSTSSKISFVNNLESRLQVTFGDKKADERYFTWFLASLMSYIKL